MRALKVGDRVRNRTTGVVGVVDRIMESGNGVRVVWPFVRWQIREDLVALPRPTKRRTGRTK